MMTDGPLAYKRGAVYHQPYLGSFSTLFRRHTGCSPQAYRAAIP